MDTTELQAFLALVLPPFALLSGALIIVIFMVLAVLALIASALD